MSKTSEFQIWWAAKNRCINPKNSGYKWYGAKGITMCVHWQTSFTNFYEDMGPRPSAGHTLDRRDTNGNYEPGNCRWATLVQQANNTSQNRRVRLWGEVHTVAEWSRLLGIPYTTARKRLVIAGWEGARPIDAPDKFDELLRAANK